MLLVSLMNVVRPLRVLRVLRVLRTMELCVVMRGGVLNCEVISNIPFIKREVVASKVDASLL